MIVSLHVATGAAVGALAGSRLAALALGPPLHLACDRVPHEDIVNRRFEIRSGLFALALLALSWAARPSHAGRGRGLRTRS